MRLQRWNEPEAMYSVEAQSKENPKARDLHYIRLVLASELLQTCKHDFLSTR